MDKRKNKTLALLPLIAVVIVAGVFAITAGKNYKVKSGPVIAAQYNSTFYEKSNTAHMKAAADYFKDEGINTLILPINTGYESIIDIDDFGYIFENSGELDKKDIVERFKSILGRKKVQLFLSVDCAGLSHETVSNTVAALCDEYKPAGIVVDNFYGGAEDLQWILKQAKKEDKNVQLWVQPVNNDFISVLSNIEYIDGFICEYTDYDQYLDIKKYTDKKVLLHYTCETLERDAFLLTNMTGVDGAVVLGYKTEETRKKLLIKPLFKENKDIPFFGFSVTNKFKLTYPTQDFTTYYKGFYILGTGEKNGIVTVNGIPYRSEKDGTFGIYYQLRQGKNTVTISQNGQSKTFNIIKKSYGTSSGGDSGSSYPVIPLEPQDNLPASQYGMIVKTVSNLNSLLADPDDDSAIVRGLDPGIKLKVVGRVSTIRNGRDTYAYKLSNGAYILEKNVKPTGEMALSIKNFGQIDANNIRHYEVPVVKGGKIERQKNYDEILTIDVNNMPAVIGSLDENKLTLHLLDTEIRQLTAAEELVDIKNSQMFRYCRWYTDDSGTYIVLEAEEATIPWGWDISVTENGVSVYIKNPPAIAKGDTPLQGVTVMLDPGHGGKDSGALGVASTNGPMEKDLNLAVAQTTRSLLEQWGATVIMTRDDDTFPSLDDRRNLCRSEKPDFFIAVHHNSMDYSYDSTNARGSECYYFNGQSEQLATLLCEEITKATGRINRGADTGYYYVTRTDICPSTLMEYSFIINPKDYSQTYTEIDIYKAAFGTLQAVLKMIPQK